MTGRLCRLGIAPLIALAVVSIVTFVDGLDPGSIGFDFRGAFLPAADAILDGESPYPPVEGPALASQSAYVYPPLLAYLVVPFTLLPETVASVLAVLGVAALLAATLVVLRRSRLALLRGDAPVGADHERLAHGERIGSPRLRRRARMALSRRRRGRSQRRSGLAVATKVILWPLLVWTLATRRLRPTAYALLIGGGVTLVAWAALGFAGLERYPAMLRRLADLEAEESYSLVGALGALGIGDGVGRVVAVLVGVALLVGCRRLRPAWRRLPVVHARARGLARAHSHRVAALPCPLARPARRRAATVLGVWLLPLLLWLTPLNGNGESIQPLLPRFVVAVVIAVALVGPSDRKPAAAPSAVAR